MVDIQTLLLASSTARTGFALIFLMASFKSDTRVAFIYWTISILGSATGLVLTYSDPHYPYFLPAYGAMTYVVLGFSISCIWAGGRAFFGSPVNTTWVVAMGLAPGAVYGVASALSSLPDLAVLLTIATLTCSMTAAAHAFLGRQSRPYLPSQLLVGAAISVYSLALTASAVAIMLKLLGPGPASGPPPSEIYLSLFIDQMLSVLTYVGLVAMSLEAAQMRMRELATTDPLTGLTNRRGMSERSAAVISAGRRSKRPMAVLIVDLDHFKAINDQHGHNGGDAVLQEFARRLSGLSRRKQDVLGRWGGEEFIAMLSDMTLEQAIGFSEGIRRRVSEYPFDLGDRAIFVTVSIGVAAIDDDAPGLEEAVRKADAALYEAKRSGRNRVGTIATPSAA